jgi:butyryl-CoA dehydrogenase
MIYEGTNGIQSIDLLGRKMTMNGGLGYKVLSKKISADVASGLASSNPTVRHVAEEVNAGLHRHQDTTSALLSSSRGNAIALLANSHEYLNFTGHTIVSWVWLKQALAAERGLVKPGVSPADAAFYNGKLFTARYFVDHELVKTLSMAELLRKNPQTNVEMQNNFF